LGKLSFDNDDRENLYLPGGTFAVARDVCVELDHYCDTQGLDWVQKHRQDDEANCQVSFQ
jgi:hypothetical protein